MKLNHITRIAFIWLAIVSCETIPGESSKNILIFPDSALNDVSNRPIGINANFLMDGGRFPAPKHTLAEALKEMGVKYLRYPGGEKSDLYLFSLPPYENSRPALARTCNLDDYPGVISAKGGYTYDPLDFDEYMEVCRSVNAEPVVVVAADGYLIKPEGGEKISSREDLIHHAAEWVRYANIKKKYGVRYWMIGNESWNTNNENSNADIYAQDVIDFSMAMKAVDPSILIIPNGASEEFFKTVISKAGDYIDRVCVSNYGVYEFIHGYDTYRDSTKCLIWPALTSVGAVEKYATEYQKKRLKVIVAEFGSIDWAHNWNWTNDIGHAIVTFDMAGQLMVQPLIEFSCFWNTRWIENESKPGVDHDALDKDGNINPTGFALKIWNEFPADRMVKTLSVPEIPCFSGFNPANNTLFVYAVNKSGNPATLKIDANNYTIKSVEDAWEYFGKTSEDIHPVWQQKETGRHLKTIQLKGYSITVLRMKVEQKNP